MLWVKALHIIFMVTWFSGLFYLPRLYVYHAMSSDNISSERFKIMERKLYYGIMMPGMVFTLIFGIWLLANHFDYYMQMTWFLLKLACVVFAIIYHFYLGYLYKQFKHDRNQHGHVYYRWLNEVPVLFLVGITILVVVRPFGILS